MVFWNPLLETLLREETIDAGTESILEEEISIDQTLDKNVKYIKWSQEKIRHFQTTNIGFWSKLHHVLTRDFAT